MYNKFCNTILFKRLSRMIKFEHALRFYLQFLNSSTYQCYKRRTIFLIKKQIHIYTYNYQKVDKITLLYKSAHLPLIF